MSSESSTSDESNSNVSSEHTSEKSLVQSDNEHTSRPKRKRKQRKSISPHRKSYEEKMESLDDRSSCSDGTNQSHEKVDFGDSNMLKMKRMINSMHNVIEKKIVEQFDIVKKMIAHVEAKINCQRVDSTNCYPPRKRSRLISEKTPLVPLHSAMKSFGLPIESVDGVKKLENELNQDKFRKEIVSKIFVVSYTQYTLLFNYIPPVRRFN